MKSKFLLILIGAAFSFAAYAADTAATPQAGRVYVLSNKLENSVLVFNRATDGSLSFLQEVPTGGAGTDGTGDPLASQGSIALRDDNKVLVAVNAVSGDLTAFHVTDSGLEFGSKVASGGFFPVSVTIHDGLVYVVNRLGFSNIAGYTVSDTGQLVQITGSRRDLAGGPLSNAGQISFTPDGEHLIVTEKGTNLIDVFNVLPNGQTEAPLPITSAGITPFGFAFGPAGSVIVSEAAGGLPMAATASSYRMTAGGGLQPVSPAVPDNGTAACWVVLTGTTAWVVNTGSASISSYSVGGDGSIALARPVAASTGVGTVPIDAAASSDNKFLYQVLSTTGQISVFGINGVKLTPLSGVNGLPLSIQGIVAD
jgi:6-phosphogluconolactonase (cycloisomerase 2 family)